MDQGMLTHASNIVDSGHISNINKNSNKTIEPKFQNLRQQLNILSSHLSSHLCISFDALYKQLFYLQSTSKETKAQKVNDKL